MIGNSVNTRSLHAEESTSAAGEVFLLQEGA